MVIQSFLENINVIENQTIKIEKGQTVEIVQVSLPLSTRKYKKILSIQYKDKQQILIPEVCTVQNLMLKFEGPALIVLNVDCESEQDRIVQVKLNCTLDTDIYKEYTEDEEEYE